METNIYIKIELTLCILYDLKIFWEKLSESSGKCNSLSKTPVETKQ